MTKILIKPRRCHLCQRLGNNHSLELCFTACLAVLPEALGQMSTVIPIICGQHIG
jgi:hypothetical protein